LGAFAAPWAAPLLASCGGRVAEEPADAASPPTAPVPDAARPVDASPRPDASIDASPVDARPPPCVCTEDLVQLAGTCEFVVADRPIACVLDRTGETPVLLDLFRSCIVDAPPSWTPGEQPTRIEQCDCQPGEVRRLCVGYR